MDSHNLGVEVDIWHLLQSLYTNVTSAVKWHDKLSNWLHEQQGLHQGVETSIGAFIARENHIFSTLDQSFLGTRIGTISVSVPACADDIALLSESPIDLQSMIRLAEADAYQKRYTYNPTKSTTMIMGPQANPEAWNTSKGMCTLGERILTTGKQESHLGLIRSRNSQ